MSVQADTSQRGSRFERAGWRLPALAAAWWSRALSELRRVGAQPLALLVLALGCELPVLAIRSVIVYLAVEVGAWVLGVHAGGLETEFALMVPVGWPALALLTPFPSGGWWRHSEGGRAPSERERLAYEDAIATLLMRDTAEVRLPAGWFVLDSPQPDAAVCGDTLMLSRGVLASQYLPAVIAHELGHINSSDGRLTAAINRLVILRRLEAQAEGKPPERRGPIRYADSGHPDTWFFEIVVMLGFALLLVARLSLRAARGGYGLRLTAPVWGSYWRAREYEADEFAARLGQADELADFLEAHALLHDRPIPFIWLTEHTHPPSELRIGRLRAHAEHATAIGSLAGGG